MPFLHIILLFCAPLKIKYHINIYLAFNFFGPIPPLTPGTWGGVQGKTTINLKTYKRLGQFSYGQHRCTTDQIHTCIKGANENNYEWIYMGEVKEGTDDIPHGIGIKVFNDGYTQQFNNKDS